IRHDGCANSWPLAAGGKEAPREIRCRHDVCRRWHGSCRPVRNFLNAMDLAFAPELEAFRAAAAAWLDEQLTGAFKSLRGLNNHVDLIDARRAWEQALGAARWSCIGYPREYGGRDAGVAEQVVFAEEYARARAPARIGHIGIELAGPTLLAFGT